MLTATESKSAVPAAGTAAAGPEASQADAELFARELGTRLGETAKQADKMAQTLEKLAGSFPGATITNRSLSSFGAAAMHTLSINADTSINIGPDMLAQMAEDGEMFDRVKSMVSSLFVAGENQTLVNVGGSQTQRAVTVSGFEMRYVEVQRGSAGTQMSVTALALETQKLITDTLDQLLNQRGQQTSGFNGFFAMNGTRQSQSWNFGALIGQSESWRLESMVTSTSGLQQMLQSSQSAVASMDLIIEQWEMAETEVDLFTYMQIMGLTDPLVLDLGDEGINLGSAEDGVYFDIKGNGSPVKTAFVKGNNALLYLDQNGNGVADDGNELFGDHGGYANGFAKLAQYDDNGDGVIDEKDEIYSKLRLWRDLNGDGVNQIEESMSMAEAGVASINLRHDDNKTLDAHGNVVGERSTFTRSDGSQGLIADVWLRNV